MLAGWLATNSKLSNHIGHSCIVQVALLTMPTSSGLGQSLVAVRESRAEGEKNVSSEESTSDEE